MPIITDAMLPGSPVFLPREGSNCTWHTQKHFVLPCVLLCHGEVHGVGNKSHPTHWPAVTAPDSHAAAVHPCQLPLDLCSERADGEEHEWWEEPELREMRRAVLESQHSPWHTHLQGRTGWWWVSAGLVWCPCLEVTAALVGPCGGTARLCHPPPAAAAPSVHSSVEFAGSQTSSVLLNCAYRSLKADTKAQQKPPSCKVLWNLFSAQGQRDFKGMETISFTSHGNCFQQPPVEKETDWALLMYHSHPAPFLWLLRNLV